MIVAFPPRDICCGGLFVSGGRSRLPGVSSVDAFDVVPKVVPFEHFEYPSFPFKIAYRPTDFGDSLKVGEDRSSELRLVGCHFELGRQLG